MNKSQPQSLVRQGIGMVVLTLALAVSHAGAGATANDSALANTIDAHIRQSRFENASWGIQIVSLQDGRTLYETNSLKLHKPASNAKLFTGALALDRLGPEFRFQTSVHALGKLDRRGHLRGDLLIHGGGDPTFSERFNGGNQVDVLKPLADAIADAGLHSVSGDLIADESYFRGPQSGGSWTWEDLQHYYGAPASALTIHDNTLDFSVSPAAKPGLPGVIQAKQSLAPLSLLNLTITTSPGYAHTIDVERSPGATYAHVTGSIPTGGTSIALDVSVPNPAQWFGQSLKQTLAQRGIKISGKVRTLDWRERSLNPDQLMSAAPLATMESRPLGEILPAMMKPSQNLYAQLLLLQVGAHDMDASDASLTTEAAGLAELQRFLDAASIARREVLFDDGSGLSRASLATPHAIVALLRHMDRHPHTTAFKDSLPIAGVDGTLVNRMKGTAAAGNVRAKTGTIRYVNSLSGYVTTANGERLAFSLLLNNYSPPDGAPSARADLDHIAIMLAEFTRNPSASQLRER